MLFIFLIFIISQSPIILSQPCPNSCNSHGLCRNPKRQCECYDGFEGPDCSLLSCPKGAAWSDKAIATDTAHMEAMCSNMGMCDYSSGNCLCKPGFEGIACEKLSCPSACNRRGKCMPMQWYAETKDPGSLQATTSNGFTSYRAAPVYTYRTVWDSMKIYGCACDKGYYGPDCSQQYCPLGDDPLTGVGIPTQSNPTQFNDIQKVTCKASSGTFTLTFRGETTIPIPFNAQASDILSALQSLPTVNGATVVMFGAQACLPLGTSFTVEFRQDFGNLPFLTVDSSDLRPVAADRLRVEKQQAGSKENEECSNRGICDAATGYCLCGANFDTSNGYNLAGTRGDCGYVLSTIQSCPGGVSCSAHGTCSGFPTFTCNCNDGWDGSDCSLKSCPEGLSWFSYPTNNEEAHLYDLAECSNMGLCDRSSGSCTCMSGFTGSSCDRLACPGDPNICNGHGNCVDMMTLATLAKENGVTQSFTYGAIPNNPKTWDYNRIVGCDCSPGYYGYDCSLRLCPTGDDPNTDNQYDEIQALSCEDADGSGFFTLRFRDETTQLIPASASSAVVKEALEALTTIVEVSIDLSHPQNPDILCAAGVQTSNVFYITFKTEHGPLPMLTAVAQRIDNLVISRPVTGNKEDIQCSGRGLCDTSLGVCTCFDGYGSSDGKGGPGTLRDCGYILPVPVLS